MDKVPGKGVLSENLTRQQFYPDKFQGKSFYSDKFTANGYIYRSSYLVDCVTQINFNLNAVDKGMEVVILGTISIRVNFILGKFHVIRVIVRELSSFSSRGEGVVETG